MQIISGFTYLEAYHSIEWNEFRKHRKDRRTAEQLTQSEERLRRGLKATENLDVQHPNIPRFTMLKKQLHDRLERHG